MHPTLVFDIETIPDLTGFAAVNGIDVSTLPPAELTEMALLARRQKTGSDFMPHHLHRIVAISCALRRSDQSGGDALKVWSLGEPGSSDITGIYSSNSNIYVDFNGPSGEIAVFNILGQEVIRTGASNGLNTLSVPQGNAVYIVKVVSENYAVTKKVFVK